jgi:hypothetical protein
MSHTTKILLNAAFNSVSWKIREQSPCLSTPTVENPTDENPVETHQETELLKTLTHSIEEEELRTSLVMESYW